MALETLVGNVNSLDVEYITDVTFRGCVTPKQIVNIKNVLDNDATQLDGYEDLPEDCQAKISKALKEGHVADEDWMGVLHHLQLNEKPAKMSRTSK